MHERIKITSSLNFLKEQVNSKNKKLEKVSLPILHLDRVDVPTAWFAARLNSLGEV